jgi:hypothetical protein
MPKLVERECETYRCDETFKTRPESKVTKCKTCRRRRTRWYNKRPRERLERRRKLQMYDATVAEVCEEEGDKPLDQALGVVPKKAKRPVSAKVVRHSSVTAKGARHGAAIH